MAIDDKRIIQHVYPDGEDHLHDLEGDTCWCGAKGLLICGEEEFEVTLSEANMIIHRAFDGRE